MPVTASPSQVPGLHTVPSGNRRQPPLPSQVPSCWQVEFLLAGQISASLALARGNEGANPERAAQIASLACLRTGRGAADPIDAEPGLALVITATGFRLSLGLAGRARRTYTGLQGIRASGGIGGVGVLLPTVFVGRLGILATTGAQDGGKGEGEGAPKGAPTPK